MPDTFTCAFCGDVCEKEWTDEEAVAEYQQNFPDGVPVEEAVVVCDDCYKKAIADDPPPGMCPSCLDPLRQEDIPGSMMGEVATYCTACGWREVSS